jgi:hypothetical protein
MAQCPKCNNLIPFNLTVKSLFVSEGKRRRLECPVCQGPLVATKKTLALVVLAGAMPALVTLPRLRLMQWVQALSFGWGVMALFLLTALSFALAACAVATMAEFEPEPPPRKFYDPDRLD